MKKMLVLTLALAVGPAFSSGGAAKAGGRNTAGQISGAEVYSVSLSVDKDDCKNGWMSMDVTVSVSTNHGTISKSFSPSCNFSYSDSFSQDGVRCELSSGMCSSFMGHGRIEVSCRGEAGISESDSERFNCPSGK